MRRVSERGFGSGGIGEVTYPRFVLWWTARTGSAGEPARPRVARPPRRAWPDTPEAPLGEQEGGGVEAVRDGANRTVNIGAAGRSSNRTCTVGSREPVHAVGSGPGGDRRGPGGGHGSGRAFAWNFNSHAQQVHLLPVGVLRVILKAATRRLSEEPLGAGRAASGVLTLALEW